MCFTVQFIVFGMVRFFSTAFPLCHFCSSVRYFVASKKKSICWWQICDFCGSCTFFGLTCLIVPKFTFFTLAHLIVYCSLAPRVANANTELQINLLPRKTSKMDNGECSVKAHQQCQIYTICMYAYIHVFVCFFFVFTYTTYVILHIFRAHSR